MNLNQMMGRSTMIKRYNLKLTSWAFIVALLLLFYRNDTYVVNAYEINNEWGYCILKNDKIIIKQTTIPTFSGSVRFKTKKEALKVGNLVLYRIKNRLSPTVTKKDLILLKIRT